MKSKNIDAVKMMRDIRAKLSKKYSDNPELLMKDLYDIRAKYSLEEKEMKKTQNKFIQKYFKKVS